MMAADLAPSWIIVPTILPAITAATLISRIWTGDYDWDDPMYLKNESGTQEREVGYFNNKNWYVKPPYADETIRELPIAIQDMSFYLDEAMGETRQFYPADHDNFLDDDGILGGDPADR